MRPFTYLYIYLFMRTNHYLRKLQLGDLGPVYMEVGDLRYVR